MIQSSVASRTESNLTMSVCKQSRHTLARELTLQSVSVNRDNEQRLTVTGAANCHITDNCNITDN